MGCSGMGGHRAESRSSMVDWKRRKSPLMIAYCGRKDGRQHIMDDLVESLVDGGVDVRVAHAQGITKLGPPKAHAEEGVFLLRVLQ